MKFQVPVNKVAEDTGYCQEYCRPVLHCTHAAKHHTCGMKTIQFKQFFFSGRIHRFANQQFLGHLHAPCIGDTNQMQPQLHAAWSNQHSTRQ